MTRADKRKYHYIYKITRLDNRYYIGMHSTDDLEDGYFGSGKLITRSIKKHGKDKHTKEILEFLPTREVLKLREKELVNRELLEDIMCMNLALGGGGDFTEDDRRKGCFRATETLRYRLANEPDFKEYFSKRCSENTKKAYAEGKIKGWQKPNTFAGRKHTTETKLKMSISKRNKPNKRLNLKWIHLGEDIKLVNIGDLDLFLNQGYSLGKVDKEVTVPQDFLLNIRKEEYQKLKPLCRNTECQNLLRFNQWDKKMSSCSKACSNRTRKKL